MELAELNAGIRRWGIASFASNAVSSLASLTNKAGTGFTSGGTNVSFSGTLSTNGLSLLGSVAAQSADTNKAGTGFTSAGSNVGISGTHGLSGLSLSITVPNQSADTGKAGTGFTSGGNNISFSGTLNTNGLSLSASVAAQSVQPVAFNAGGVSSNFSTILFQDSNGISFSNNVGSVRMTHALQYTSNTSAITSAAAGSGHSHGNPTLALTNLTGTTASASNGFTLSLSVASPGLTTAAASDHSHGNPTLALTNLTGTTASASNGFTLSLSAASPGLTTAAASDHSHGNPTLALTNLTGTTASASNGLTLSLSAASQSVQPVAFSAGAATSAFSTLIFQDSNGVSFSNNAGSVRVSHALQFTSNTSAITSAAAGSGHSHGNPTLNLTNLTGTTNSASNGFTLSLSAAAPGDTVVLSHYANFPNLQPMVTGTAAITQTSGSSMFIQPFTLPYNVSVSYIRLFASFNDSAVGTAGTTSANTNFSVGRFTTIAAVLYSNGVGANSRSLQSMSSSSGGMTGKTFYSAGAQGSQYTITLQKTYPLMGAITNQYTTQYAVSSASIVISSNSNTLFTGPRYLDIPFGYSIPKGVYWLGIGASTSSASQTSHISFAGTCALPISLHGVSQSDISFGVLGAATSASDYQLYPGLGVWTTNAATLSRDSIGLNSISQVVSNPQLPFQFIRQA